MKPLFKRSTVHSRLHRDETGPQSRVNAARVLTLAAIGALLLCWSCSNIEDATPSERKTFIRFYEAPRNLAGVVAEPTDNGYIVIARETVASGNVNGLVLRTDANGAENAPRLVLPGFTPTALKKATSGYYVSGDRIQFNPDAENLFDLTVTSAMLYKISLTGSDTASFRMEDNTATAKVDYRGSSVTADANGNIIMLGTFKEARAAAYERPFLVSLNASTLDSVWSKRYDALERDYVNSKSLFVNTSGQVIWATALLREAGDLSRTFLSVPFVEENSVFINSDLFGETTDQKLLANDLQQATSPELGFGLIGTYAQPTGGNANMFFIRVDKSGNFILGSDRYFDAELLAAGEAVTQGQSSSQETGDALIATRDGGYILAGSFASTPQLGNGGNDILLVKVSATGTMLWNKVIGGAGDETVSTIRETADGGLLLCGTNAVSGLSSIFLMKVDAHGELND
jgi:hypothetical protein